MVQFRDRWTCSPFFKGFVFQLDGCLLSSVKALEQQYFEAALQISGVSEVDADVRQQIEAYLGLPEQRMCSKLEQLLRYEFRGGPIASLAPGDFEVPFTELRARGWVAKAADGAIATKEGALRLLDRLRRGRYFVGVRSLSPGPLTQESIDNVMHATDILPPERIVAADDERLRFSPDRALGAWHALTSVAATRGMLAKEMVAVDSRPGGVIAALEAGFGAVVVVPDGEDGPIGTWDRAGHLAAHLRNQQTDRNRLFFLRSLLDIHFS